MKRGSAGSAGLALIGGLSLSLLTDNQIRRGVHRSTAELETAIGAYIEAHNADPKPFRWIKSADDILAAINRFCRRTLDTAVALRPIKESAH